MLSHENKALIKWMVLFSGLMAGFYLFSESDFFLRHINPVFITLQAKISSVALGIIGVSHELEGTIITSHSRQFVIADSCSGLSVYFLFLSAAVSFPTSLISRLTGVVMGFISLLTLNILRIVMIVAAGSRFPGSFWALHIIAGQALVICGMAGTFLVWLQAASKGASLVSGLNTGGIIRFISLFAIGYCVGYAAYILFLDSPLGQTISILVQDHTYGIMAFLESGSQMLSPGFRMPRIGFVEGCLSSPVFVILFALLTAWPCTWKRKAVIALAGYVPLFYIYHLMRSLTVVLSFASGTTRESSVIYNCYGQFIIAGIIIAGFLGHQATGTPYSWRNRLMRWGTGLTAGAIAAFLGGSAVKNSLMPTLILFVSGNTKLILDPQLTLSTMPYFQFFLAHALAWSHPTSLKHRFFGALALTGILILFETLTISAIYGLWLTPHIGILKGLVMIVPAAAYHLLFRKAAPPSSKQNPLKQV